jgi:hypothetical protein
LWQSVDYGESTIIGAVGTPGEDDWQLCALDGVAINCLGNENWVKLDTTNGNPNSGLTIGNMYLYGSGKELKKHFVNRHILKRKKKESHLISPTSFSVICFSRQN